MRTLIYQTLTTDPAVLALVPVERVFLESAIQGTPPAPPFIVLRYTQASVSPSRSTKQWDLEVWAHQVPGDYDQVDAILRAVEGVMLNAFPLQRVREDGVLVSVNVVDPQGESGDLEDPDMRTNTRNSGFRLTVSER